MKMKGWGFEAIYAFWTCCVSWYGAGSHRYLIDGNIR